MKSRKADDWLPPIVLTEAVNDKGTEELAKAFLKHLAFLKESSGLSIRRKERARLELLETVEADTKAMISNMDGGQLLEKLLDAIQNGKTTPQNAAREIINRIENRKGK